MENDLIKIDCIELHQPIGVFYVGKINIKDLIEISFSDIRRIEREEKNDHETFFGIQRNLSISRVNEISDYVRTSDATFPTSILLSISSNFIDNPSENGNVLFDKTDKILYVKRDRDIAQIIDGQHRVFGLKKAYENSNLFQDDINDFDILVTIFVDIDPENQALVFSIINKAQTKVNKSLVYDLFELSKTNSPQRSCHNIVKLLNEKQESPFKDKIKMLGLADDSSKETIAQATIVELLLRYISENPMLDRDNLKRGKRLNLINGKELEKYFLRNWFISGEDAKIAKLIWNYFNAIKNKWPLAWDDNSKILSKSTGIIAFMKYLKDIVLTKGIGKIISEEEFRNVFEPVNLTDEEFVNSKFKSGGVGQSELYKIIKEQARL